MTTYLGMSGSLTIGEIFKDNKSIGELDAGDEEIITCLTFMITNLNNFFSVGKRMDSNQVYETSMVIAKNRNHLSLPDFALCFDRAKAGHYNNDVRIYDCIDSNLINQYLSCYEAERAIFIENHNRSGHYEKYSIGKVDYEEFKKRGSPVEEKQILSPFTVIKDVEWFLSHNITIHSNFDSIKKVDRFYDFFETIGLIVIPNEEKKERYNKKIENGLKKEEAVYMCRFDALSELYRYFADIESVSSYIRSAHLGYINSRIQGEDKIKMA
jgi:hypothetical protein